MPRLWRPLDVAHKSVLLEVRAAPWKRQLQPQLQARAKATHLGAWYHEALGKLNKMEGDEQAAELALSIADKAQATKAKKMEGMVTSSGLGETTEELKMMLIKTMPGDWF